jgi:hypothetical protein
MTGIISAAFFAWLVRVLVALYGLWLATRFVQAVERIAERLERRTT